MKHPHHRRRHGPLFAIARMVSLVLLALVFAVEIYTVSVQQEADSPLPPQFGNFESNRAALEKTAEPGTVTFAAVGDTKSIGTFERIAAELRKIPLDFAVLLGDCTFDGTEAAHRYFRAELSKEYALPVPVFYVIGNHDVSLRAFPIRRFEQIYGPSIFSFEYRQCLFVVLRILDPPFTNEESLAFLAGLRDADLSRYRHKFAFMHIPPPVTSYARARYFQESQKLMALFDEIGIDYAFAGDFHGYAESKKGNTTYIITGGGGANLRKDPGNQFHHATIVRVGPDSVDTRIVSVPAVNDIEDRLEKLAIIEVWPWMQQNTAWAVALNLLGAVGFVLLAAPLFRRPGRSGPGAAASGRRPPKLDSTMP